MEERLRQLEIQNAEHRKDLKYIIGRLDNGISATVTKIFDKLDGMVPQVKDNTEWVAKFKQAIWWISVIAVSGGIVTIGVAVVRVFVLKAFE